MIHSDQAIDQYGSQKAASAAFQRAISKAHLWADYKGEEFVILNDSGYYFIASRATADQSNFPIMYSTDD